MEQNDTVGTDFVHLARIALTCEKRDVQLFLRRMAKRYRLTAPTMADGLISLLQENPTPISPLRKSGVAVAPVDADTHHQLLRIEDPPILEVEPVLTPAIESSLRTVVMERRNRRKLAERGLEPTKTFLFTGAPGTGKTLAARWLAREIGVPIMVLDLSSVMSSFLGRTGANLKQVIDYAKGVDCVLFLDELDAIAKKRDDTTEIGELKRLVAVLLQEIDSWPSDGLIVAATNHPGLLDPAVWRRFERRIEFGSPSVESLRLAIERFLGSDQFVAKKWPAVVASVMQGATFSDVERTILGARRAAAIGEKKLSDLLKAVVEQHVSARSKQDRALIAAQLVSNDLLSQREAHELTGVSRDTIRKRTSTR